MRFLDGIINRYRLFVDEVTLDDEEAEELIHNASILLLSGLANDNGNGIHVPGKNICKSDLLVKLIDPDTSLYRIRHSMGRFWFIDEYRENGKLKETKISALCWSLITLRFTISLLCAFVIWPMYSFIRRSIDKITSG